MTDRNTISHVIESLFEDWFEKNENIHPLAVENMRILEADAIAMLKEQRPVKVTVRFNHTDNKYFDHYKCPSCGSTDIYYEQHYCDDCGKALDWSEMA